VEHSTMKQFERAIDVLHANAEQQGHQLVVSERCDFPDERISTVPSISNDDICIRGYGKQILQIKNIKLPIGVRKKQILVPRSEETRPKRAAVSGIPVMPDASDPRVSVRQLCGQFGRAIGAA